MKNVLSTCFFLLATTIIAQTASADSMWSEKSASQVKCKVRTVTIASPDLPEDGQSAKLLTIEIHRRPIAKAVSTNFERIQFLAEQCKAATIGNAGAVMINAQTGEVVPKSGRYNPRILMAQHIQAQKPTIKMLGR